MNKYLPGQTLYLFIDDDGTTKMKGGIVNAVFLDGESAFNYNLVFSDGTNIDALESEVTDNIALIQSIYNQNFDFETVPALPLLKVGQSVFVVTQNNIRFKNDGVSIQSGRIVACSNSSTANQYLVNLDNPSSYSVNLTDNQNQMWLRESQFGTEDSGGTGTNFFISYNEAVAFYQMLTSQLISWKLNWNIPGADKSGSVTVLGNTTSNIILGTLDEPSSMEFQLEALSDQVTVENVVFVSGSLWADVDVTTPIAAEANTAVEIGSASMESTGGVEDTAIVKFTTAYNILTLNFQYTKA